MFFGTWLIPEIFVFLAERKFGGKPPSPFRCTGATCFVSYTAVLVVVSLTIYFPLPVYFFLSCILQEFEKEIIVKLDAMIETGSGDDHYKVLFRQIMMSHCMSHTALNRSGEALVDLVTRWNFSF